MTQSLPDSYPNSNSSSLETQPTEAEQLLPQPDTPYSSTIGQGTVVRYYVRDGNRLIGAVDGITAETWFVTAEGIRMSDAAEPSPLLYFPAQLQENVAWKQAGSQGQVWFLLRRPADQRAGDDRWELTVLPCLPLIGLRPTNLTRRSRMR